MMSGFQDLLTMNRPRIELHVISISYVIKTYESKLIKVSYLINI